MRVVLEDTDRVEPVDRTAGMSNSLLPAAGELHSDIRSVPVTSASKAHQPRVRRSPRKGSDCDRQLFSDQGSDDPSEEIRAEIVASVPDAQEESSPPLLDLQASTGEKELASGSVGEIEAVLNVRS